MRIRSDGRPVDAAHIQIRLEEDRRLAVIGTPVDVVAEVRQILHGIDADRFRRRIRERRRAGVGVGGDAALHPELRTVGLHHINGREVETAECRLLVETGSAPCAQILIFSAGFRGGRLRSIAHGRQAQIVRIVVIGKRRGVLIVGARERAA